MQIYNPLRYLMVDHWSLEMYRKGILPKPNDIQRHLILKEREDDYHLSDHYYRDAWNSMIQKMNVSSYSLSTILTIGVGNYSSDFLQWRDYTIYVKPEKFNDWQMQLGYWSPLVLKAAFINRTHPWPDKDYMEYMLKYVMPNFKYTSIPETWITEMNWQKQAHHGFKDLHLHLNGALETDFVWQDALSNPAAVYHEISQNMNDNVKEQYDQLLNGMNVADLWHLWIIASRLRTTMYEFIVEGKGLQINGKRCKSLQEYLNNLYLENDDVNKFRNPILRILGDHVKDDSPIALECMLMVCIFNYMTQKPSEEIICHLFLFYLLILGQLNTLLVQNCRQYGFNEFQKFTSNGVRNSSEEFYVRRFFQMAGNRLNNVSHFEGRFSPKSNQSENEKIISRITKGFSKFKQASPQTSLSLIAHFIKKADEHPDDFIRHKKLRKELEHKANVLGIMVKQKNIYVKDLVGIDAAASEFDAPPEVFAKTYEEMRKAGIRHFTYHAGEDFIHILDGMRAVYEAVCFLGLRQGDRIGHAVACGIDPHFWHNRVGDKIMIRQGDYLDDLLFVFYLITKNNDFVSSHLSDLVPKIVCKVVDLSCSIYGRFPGIEVLVQSWLSRKLDPFEIMRKSKEYSQEQYQLLLDYHCKKYRDKYNQLEEVNSFGILSENDITELQLLMLNLLSKREIVIETLPTSNVFIGSYDNYITYHLARWLKWQREGKLIPAIVVGSDDDGIFSTDIYNEYCHIYAQLVFDQQASYQQAQESIEWLIHNADVYAFSKL